MGNISNLIDAATSDAEIPAKEFGYEDCQDIDDEVNPGG